MLIDDGRRVQDKRPQVRMKSVFVARATAGGGISTAAKDFLDKNTGRRRLRKWNRVKSGWQDETHDACEWDEWLAQHARKLLLYARQRCFCEADACDLVQEAMVESWQQRSNGSPPPLALVFTIIRRRALDLARRENRRQKRETAAYESAGQDWFDSDVEDRERNRLLQFAMSSLPELQREVITLKLWGGLTFAEIARMLEIPADTAASRYRYGLEELRKLTKEVFT